MKSTPLNIEGNCPVQADGLIDDHPYYFRARGEGWEMTIARPDAPEHETGTPRACLPEREYVAYFRCGYIGEWPAAGWISVEDAKALIEMCFAQFKGGARGDCTPVT